MKETNSSTQFVMDSFMEKLSNHDFIYSKETPLKEVTLDNDFIDREVKSYQKLLTSPLIKPKGPTFVKKKS